MREYKFLDTDPMGFGWEEYDIVGEDHAELIRTCCKYSKTVSFAIGIDKWSLIEKLEAYRIPKDNNITFISPVSWRNGIPDEIRYYRVCPELCELLIQYVDNIWDWLFANPEDPIFYRADGSVFFKSRIHDGWCILTPRDDENVDHIVKKAHWLKIKG